MILLRNLALSRGPHLLFSGVSLTLERGWRVGLVGANGSGKSSLLALLAGRARARRRRLRDPARHAPGARRAGGAGARAQRARLPARRGPGVARSARARSPPPRRAATATRSRTRTSVSRMPAATRRARAPWSLLAGPGLRAGRRGARRARVLRRLSHAPQPRARADRALRPAAARRAHQPPRPRHHPVAGGLAARLRGHADRRLARPRFPRPRLRRIARHPAGRVVRPGAPVRRRLFAVRERARGGTRAAVRRRRAAGPRDPPHHCLRRALPRQGDQGAPGAEPAQAPGAHGARCAGDRGRYLPLRIRGARAPARAHPRAARGRRGLRRTRSALGRRARRSPAPTGWR